MGSSFSAFDSTFKKATAPLDKFKGSWYDDLNPAQLVKDTKDLAFDSLDSVGKFPMAGKEAAKEAAGKQGKEQANALREANVQKAKQKTDNLKVQQQADITESSNTEKISERTQRKGKKSLLTGSSTGLGNASTLG